MLVARQFRRVLALALITAVALAPTTALAQKKKPPRHAPGKSTHSAKHAKQAELTQLGKQITALRSTLSAAHERQDALRAELQRAETEVAHASRALHDIEQQSHDQQRELTRLHREQREQRAQLNDHRRLLAALLRAQYTMGRQDFVKMLLHQQDPAKVGRALAYYDYLSRARAERIATINDQLLHLAQLERDIAARGTRLVHLKADTANQQQTLEKTRTQRAQVLAKLGDEIQTKEQRLASLEEDKHRLEELIKRLRSAPPPPPPPRRAAPAAPGITPPPPQIADGTAFAKLRGRLNWPVSGPIAARFGTPRAQGMTRWQGVLIAASEGREVHAIARGRVVFADWLRGYGWLLILDHGEGYLSLYGQNQSLHKQVNAVVETGEVVATSGASGGQDTPGVYLEIRRLGVPVDPAAWCSGT